MCYNVLMTQRKRNRAKIILIRIGLFAAIFAVVFIGIQFITKTGIFKVPGVARYDDSLTRDERVTLQAIFTEDVKLDQDVTISATDYLELPQLSKGEYVYNISVPVTDFYSTETNINATDPATLFADKAQDPGYQMINLADLDFTKKLLAINHNYYLDTFDKGAVFRVIKFDSPKFTEEIEPLVATTFNKSWPEKTTTLTMLQTGVTALSRGMNQKLNEVGDPTFFSREIADFLKNADITHTSNESSFSENATSENICSDPRFINTLLDIGLDVVELTGNHNVDCGATAAENTIDIYTENNIKTVGGGKTATEAAVPLDLTDKGTSVTMLAYNLSTGGATTGNTPGANQYEESRVATDIATAKEQGHIVIVDIQYYECSAYASEYEDPTCDAADSAAGDQVGLFRHLIDLGADIVVGTSAHQPQTFELYNNGVIYYGLGNLFFDQAWWPGTTRSLALKHYFYNGQHLQTTITPTAYDENYQTRIMDSPEWYLQRLISARPAQ